MHMAKAEATHGERQISSTTGGRGCPVPKTQGAICPGPLKLPETGLPYRGRVSVEIFPPARGKAPGSPPAQKKIPLEKKKKKRNGAWRGKRHQPQAQSRTFAQRSQQWSHCLPTQGATAMAEEHSLCSGDIQNHPPSPTSLLYLPLDKTPQS